MPETDRFGGVVESDRFGGIFFRGGSGGDRGLFRQAQSADFLTGEERGRGTLPELGSLADVADSEFGDIAIAAGFFTTNDEAARADILRKNVPGIDFANDEFGNAVVLLPDGRSAFLNAPGFSLQDFADLGSNIVKFLPAAKFASAGKTLLSRFFLGGSAAGVTSIAEDVAAIPQGSEQGVNLPRAAITAGIGAGAELLGPVLAGTRLTPEPVTRTRTPQSFQQAPTEAPRIPLTQSQRAGDVPGILREQQIRTQGGFAGDVLRAGEAEQTAQARTIIAEIEEDIARTGGRPAIQGAQDIIDEVTLQSQTLLNSIDDAFAAVGKTNATITRKGLDDLAGIKTVLVREGIEPDPVLFPATKAALDKIDSLFGKEVTSKTLSDIELVRRTIGTLQGASRTPADRFGVGLVKKRLDQWLDDVVDNALFTGDEAALDLIKNARSLRAEFGRRFQENTRRTRSGKIIADPGGKVVESILTRSPTDEAVVNMIFGRGRLFNDNNAVRVVKSLKSAAGNAPSVDAALQQLALRRIGQKALVDEGFDPKLFVSNFDNAFKKSPALMRELFPPDILKRLRTFRNDASKIVPPKGASAATISASRRQARNLWVSTMGGLGLAGKLPFVGSGLRAGLIGQQIGRSGQNVKSAISDANFALNTLGAEATLPGRPADSIIASIIAATRQGTE